MKLSMKRAARGLSFAHLAGNSSRAAADDNEGHDVDDDGTHPVPAEGADDEPEKGAKKAKAKDGADDEDDGAGKDDLPSSDDGDGDDDGDKKGKKAKAKAKADGEGDEEDGGDGDDDQGDDKEIEMRGNSAIAQARRREQARCAAIFASKAAARNPQLAANLAFKSRTPRHEAIAILEGSVAGSAPDHSQRASLNPQVGPGRTSQQTSHEAIASGWDRAFASVNPRRAR